MVHRLQLQTNEIVGFFSTHRRGVTGSSLHQERTVVFACPKVSKIRLRSSEKAARSRRVQQGRGTTHNDGLLCGTAPHPDEPGNSSPQHTVYLISDAVTGMDVACAWVANIRICAGIGGSIGSCEKFEVWGFCAQTGLPGLTWKDAQSHSAQAKVTNA